MEIFETTCKLRNADVDMHRRFKTASLLTLLQETAIAHTEAIGMGRERTLDRGLLWIITLQRLSILRMPVYDETITVQCWPGKTMHVLFPRYYRMTSETGELLLEGSALWALIDEQFHQLIFPDDYGIRIPGLVTGQETPLPRAPKAVPLTHQTEFTVPYTYVDLNRHMNNVRYLDLAENTIPHEAHDHPLKSLEIEYSSEAKLGQTIRVQWGKLGGVYFVDGEDERRLFRVRLEYDEKELLTP